MRYDKRCTFIIVEETETPLGLEEKETFIEKVCAEQNISLEEKETVFGKNQINGVKLHFSQRITEDISKVQYNKEEYKNVYMKPFRRKTVLYLSRSGHSG